MSTETTNYLREASDDAGETIRNFADEILEQLLDSGKASDDLLNDYPNGDSWHHECHVDKGYSLHEAAELLDQLDDFEETDSGLWEGQSFREAISTCAAFTYGNAVYNEWREKIEQINRDAEIILDDYNDRIAEIEDAGDDEKVLDEPLGYKSEKDEDAEKQRYADIAALEEERKEALAKLIENVVGTP